MENLEGGGRLQCSLCHQGWRVLVPAQLWPTSRPGVLPGAHLRGACPALATEGGAKLPKEERNLSKEGLEDEEERVSHAPEGQPF